MREIERGMLISEEILRHLVTVLEDRGPADELAPAAAARDLGPTTRVRRRRWTTRRSLIAPAQPTATEVDRAERRRADAEADRRGRAADAGGRRTVRGRTGQPDEEARRRGPADEEEPA